MRHDGTGLHDGQYHHPSDPRVAECSDPSNAMDDDGLWTD